MSQCPNKKKDKWKTQVAASAEIDEFAANFEEFSLVVVCCSSTSSRSAQFVYSDEWFVDSGTSRHMTGMREVFINVSKIDSDMHVKAMSHGSGSDSSSTMIKYDSNSNFLIKF